MVLPILYLEYPHLHLIVLGTYFVLDSIGLVVAKVRQGHSFDMEVLLVTIFVAVVDRELAAQCLVFDNFSQLLDSVLIHVLLLLGEQFRAGLDLQNIHVF